ncbi:MAG TPA: hypothetical protein PLB12_10610, partial [Candidatus Goldiibacteriota bacterium]|nr:hypothetical protein [Candidatus Goldiibacteriota bacterium]
NHQVKDGSKLYTSLTTHSRRKGRKELCGSGNCAWMRVYRNAYGHCSCKRAGAFEHDKGELSTIYDNERKVIKVKVLPQEK